MPNNQANPQFGQQGQQNQGMAGSQAFQFGQQGSQSQGFGIQPPKGQPPAGARPSSAQLLRSALQAEADAGIASSLVCPITSELMTDPVFTMDGHTYERSAIEAWLKNNDTSPATGKRLPSKMLVDNVRDRKRHV